MAGSSDFIKSQMGESAETRENRKVLEKKDKLAADEIKRRAEGNGWPSIFNSRGEFSTKITLKFDEMSAFGNHDLKPTAKKVIDLVKNAEHYEKVIDYFLSKGPGGVEVAKELISYAIDKFNDPKNPKDQAKQDRNLMLAAKLGDRALFDKAISGGAALYRDNKLVVNEYGQTILHYAGQGPNAVLIRDIAEDLRKNADKKFKIPKDSTVDNVFDPYRIRDDIVAGEIVRVNYVRPIHFMDPTTAKSLDALYGLPPDAPQGSFSSAVNYYKIDNKVLSRGFKGWLGEKLHKHHHAVEVAALSGKGLAGIPVANIADKAANMAMNLAESATFVGIAATLVGVRLAYRNDKTQKAARNYTGASKHVYLGADGKSINPVKYNNRHSNHDLEAAIKVRDFVAIDKIISSNPMRFKCTTEELLVLVKQILYIDTKKYPDLKEKLFTALVNKLDPKDSSYRKIFNKILDMIYRQEDNTMGLNILNNLPAGINNLVIKEWKQKFENNTLQPTILKKGYKNSELIHAIKTYDFYKIQHIISRGQFRDASKDVINALQKMSVLPQDSLTTVTLNKPFMQVVYEGLANKATPKNLHKLLDDLIYNLKQPELGQKIIANLITKYERIDPKLKDANSKTHKVDNAAKENLIICALLSARTGDILNLDRALNALKTRHNMSLIDIVDEKGSNILHFAAKAQNSNMIQHILENTSIINDFIIADERKKHDRGFSIKIKSLGIDKHTTIRTAKHVMEMPNESGETPLKILKSKDAVASLDAYLGNTVGFRMDSNEDVFNRDMKHQSRVNLAANLTVVAIALGACSMWGVPLAIGLGKSLGSMIAAQASVSILPNITIGGGLMEGGFAVTAAKVTENAAMPLLGGLFRAIDKHLSKTFNGDYMRTNRDYDDRIVSMSQDLVLKIANEIAKINPTTQEAMSEIMQRLVKEAIGHETDPVKKALISFACIKVANMIAQNTPTQEKDLLKILESDKAVILKAAEKISKNANFSRNLQSLLQSKEIFEKQLNAVRRSDFKKINRKLDRFIIQIERLKELCASDAEINQLKADESYKGWTRDAIFREAAIKRAEADLQRLENSDPTSTESEKQKITKDHADRLQYIETLTTISEQILEYRRDQIYSRRYATSDSNKEKIENEFLDQLHKIEGGIGKGPLVKKADFLLNTDRKTMEAELDAAFKKLKHPQPAKAIEMRQAIAAFFDRKKFSQENLVKQKGKPPELIINTHIDAIQYMTNPAFASHTQVNNAASDNIHMPPSPPLQPIKTATQAPPTQTITTSLSSIVPTSTPTLPYHTERSTMAGKISVDSMTRDATWLNEFLSRNKLEKSVSDKPETIKFTSATQNVAIYASEKAVTSTMDLDEPGSHQAIAQAIVELYLQGVKDLPVCGHVIKLSETNDEILHLVEVVLAKKLGADCKILINGQSCKEIIEPAPPKLVASITPTTNEPPRDDPTFRV